MDDLIFKAVICQDDHWVDRSALLKAQPVVVTDAVKVVLLILELWIKSCVAFFLRFNAFQKS